MNALRIKRPSTAFVVAMVALFVALGGTAGAVVTAAVPLAKRALVADNAKKLNGVTAGQLGSAAVQLALKESPAGSRPASTAAGLVATKTQSGSVGAGAAQAFTVACDTGQKVLGGGFSSTGFLLGLASYPSNESTWSILVANLDDAAAATVNAYATCIK